jgi:hypothetical protein
VAVVIVLLVLGVVQFRKSRGEAQRRTCLWNLKQIDGALLQWALENRKTPSDSYALSELPLDYWRSSIIPHCPAGGTYSPGATIVNPPVCSVPGHKLSYETNWMLKNMIREFSLTTNATNSAR